jgi:hypothetical protein
MLHRRGAGFRPPVEKPGQPRAEKARSVGCRSPEPVDDGSVGLKAFKSEPINYRGSKTAQRPV